MLLLQYSMYYNYWTFFFSASVTGAGVKALSVKINYLYRCVIEAFVKL